MTQQGLKGIARWPSSLSVILTKYYPGDKINKHAKGRASGTTGQKTGAHSVLVGKTGRKNHLEDLDVDGRIIFKWIFIGEKGVALVDLAQNGDKWRAELNGNQSSVSINEGNFWTSWVTISFSRSTLLHGVTRASVTGGEAVRTRSWPLISIQF